MKRNSMRIAALLLVLVLLTTAAVGGTFAKYITTVENKDNARVAYWGFEDSGLTNFEGEPAIVKFNLFDPTYLNGDKTTVKSEDGDDIYAPGTKGEANVTFNFIGRNGITAPEVAYTFGIEAEFCSSGAAEWYEHMTYTLKNSTNTVNVTCTSQEDLLKAIAKLVDPSLTDEDIEITDNEDETAQIIKVTKEYGPNELPDFMENKAILTIGWDWTFENAEDEDWDGEDTNLGNSYFYSGENNYDTMSLTLKINATQID